MTGTSFANKANTHNFKLWQSNNQGGSDGAQIVRIEVVANAK